MLFTNFSAGNKEYKLRLNTRNVIELEKQLGCNPLAIFGKGDTIPTTTAMVAVLHCSLQQYQSGIKYTDALDIFDAYLEDGNSATDFINVIVEVYKVSGIIKEDATEKN